MFDGHEDDDCGTTGLWVRDKERQTQVAQGTNLQPYTALWAPSRTEANTVEAKVSAFTVPAW